MRKLFIVALVLMSCMAVWSAGKEEAKPIALTFLHTPAAPMSLKGAYAGPITGDNTYQAIYKLYLAKHPNVTIKDIDVDLSTGSTMSMDAMIASGQAPDLYLDAALRASKYIVPEYALNLKPYFTDWADFDPAALATVTKKGGVYAMLLPGWATGMCVNTDLMAEAGYTVPENWTTDQFLEMAAKVKAKGKWATYLFAQNQSSNQWWMWYFYAFGAKEFVDGDYSKTRINSPEAVRALRYMKGLIDAGYVRPDAAGLSDGDVLNDFAAGKVAAGAMQTGHIGVIDTAVKNGTIKKAFGVKFVAFPHAPNVAGTPAAAGNSVIVVKATKDEARNKAAAELAYAVSDKEMQALWTYIAKGYPTRKSVTDLGGLGVHDQAVMSIISRFGTMDLGISTPQFPAVRASMFPLLQAFYQGKMTAEELLGKYERTVNDIMAGK